MPLTVVLAVGMDSWKLTTQSSAWKSEGFMVISAGSINQLVPAAISVLTSESLFELSPDAILVADCGGVIRAANSRSAELFGYSGRSFRASPLKSRFPNASTAAI